MSKPRGSIEWRGPNSFRVRVSLGRDENGKQKKSRWVSGHGTERDAEKAITDLLARHDKGLVGEANNTTVLEQMRYWNGIENRPPEGTRVCPEKLDLYYRSIHRPKAGAAEIARTDQYIANQIAPHPIASIAVQKLTPAHARAWLNTLAMCGHRYTNGPLAPNTIRHVFQRLRDALDLAVIDDIIAVNPLRRVEVPSVPEAETVHVTTRNMQRLLSDVTGTWLHPFVLIDNDTGVRRGELLGLRYKDVIGAPFYRMATHQVVEEVGKVVRVRPWLKTKKSRRVISIDPETFAAIASWRQTADAFRAKVGVPATTGDDLIFVDFRFGPITPRNASRAVKDRLSKLKIVGSLHSLRHTVATEMLKRERIDPDTGKPYTLIKASRRLGHSKVSTTTDIYGHEDENELAWPSEDEIADATPALPSSQGKR